MTRKRHYPLSAACVAQWSGSQCRLPPAQRLRQIGDVWTDSRRIRSGDLFVALKTGRDDGHCYVESALHKGAVAAIVNKSARGMLAKLDPRRLMYVNDTLAALHALAAAYRKDLGVLIVGITGSSGKTTTRSIMEEVLSKQVPVGATRENWNNHIGVPLSLLRFTGREYAGIIEMGANHLREIHALSLIARPDIAVITNIGYGHVGLFGSLEATVNAKFEIVDGLNGADGFLLLNGDDPRIVVRAKSVREKVLFFGCSKRCSVRALDIQVTPHATAFSVDGTAMRLPVSGRHFVYAALPAVALGRKFGMSERQIVQALAQVKPVSMRGEIKHKHGVTFLLDCYNANPSSMEIAIEQMAVHAPASRRVAVLGDMLELGVYAKQMHRRTGKTVAGTGVRRLVAVGEFAHEIAAGARSGGTPKRAIVTAVNTDEALEALNAVVKKGDTVLLKASRAIGLEKVFNNF